MRVLSFTRDANSPPEGREDGAPAFLEWEASQRYRHALGGNGPFYRGLAEGRLRASRCRECGTSWFPPSPFCRKDLRPAEWRDLPGTGRIVSAAVVHSPPPFGGIRAPYVLAAIRLDGAEGGITHRVAGDAAPRHGAPVRARFGAPEGDAHPLLGLFFEVEEAANGPEPAEGEGKK